MKKTKYIITCLFFLLISLHNSQAADCTITLNNGANIQNSINTASAGSTICLNGGTYTSPITISKPLTLKSVSASNRATINCASCNLGEYESIIKINASNVTIQDINVKNTGDHFTTAKDSNVGISAYSNSNTNKNSNTKLINVNVDNIIGFCVLFEKYDYGLIDGGTYSNCNMENSPAVKAARPEFHWDWGSSISIASGSNYTTVRNILMHDSWGEGINFWSGSSYGLAENNVLYDIWSAAIYTDRSSHTVIRNNYIYSTQMSDGVVGRPIEVMDEDGPVTSGFPKTEDIKVYNNVVVVDKNAGKNPACIGAGDFQGGGLKGSLSFFNNTCVRTSGLNGQANNLTAKNNLFINATAINGTNSLTNPAIGVVNANAAGTPLPDVLNFKLAANSQAINSGSSIEIDYDFFGCKRSGNPDIGATEYNGSNCNRTLPPVPTNTPVPTQTPIVSPTPIPSTISTVTPTPTPIDTSTCTDSPFQDVGCNDQFKNYIIKLKNNNISKGFADGSYKPNNHITRGEAASILTKAFSLNINSAATFKDSIEGPHANSIKILAALGISGGYSDGTYKKDKEITRGEFSKMIFLTMKYKNSSIAEQSQSFPDVDSNNKFKGYIGYLSQNSIVNGYSSGKFGVNDSITRGQVAKMIILALEKVNILITPTITPTATTTPAIGTPISLSTWQFYSNAGGTYSTTNDIHTVNLIGDGSNIQLMQTGIKFVAGGNYKITFRASSSRSRDIGVHLLQNTSPYSFLGLEKSVSLNSSEQLYTINFTVSGFSGESNDTRLRFWLSGGTQNGDQIMIKDFKIQKV